MNVLYQSAFLKALGWSLLDSFWQMGVLWLIYILLTGNGKKFKSGQKHTLALLSLSGGAIWFLITLIFHFYEIVDETAFTVNTISSADTISTNPSIKSFFSFLEPSLPFLSVAYLLSVIYLFIRLYRQYYATQKLFSTGIHKARPELRVFLNHIAAQMGIKKDVRIWLSDLVDTPLTIGFWKPVILLPVAAINHLSLQQAEAIILHELNHIRRNDYFINLLIACMDILLFFNPFVRVLTHIIKNERENSCDDMVLQFRYDAGHYANALLVLERNRTVSSHLTLNATGRSKKLLLQRVERILNKRSSGNSINQRLLAYVITGFLIALIGLYNPGKVIVKTIDTVQDEAGINDRQLISFSIPEVVTDKSIKQVTATRIKTKTGKPNAESDEQLSDNAEGIVDWITDVTPVERANPEDLSSLVSYADDESEIRDYSISESNSAPIQPLYSADLHPYVPSTSFSYQVVEDTALPKKYILTHKDIKANEAMTSALKALQEIDWQKVEKEMSAAGKKVDVVKLQQELKKALADIDWKKINDEMQSSGIEAENELLQEHANLQTELKKFQLDRKLKLADQQKIHRAIIQERLCEGQNQETQPVKKKITSKKKIVYI